jgi:hypothetical protein
MELVHEEKANAQESTRGGAWPLGGSVRSVAKQRANYQNGRKGGLVKSRKKTLAVRRNARRPRPGRRKKS